MNRYYWPALFLLTVLAVPHVVADPVDLRVGQPFPTDLLLPSIEDGRPSSAELFQGKKTIAVIFASW